MFFTVNSCWSNQDQLALALVVQQKHKRLHKDAFHKLSFDNQPSFNTQMWENYNVNDSTKNELITLFWGQTHTHTNTHRNTHKDIHNFSSIDDSLEDIHNFSSIDDSL